MSRRHGPAFVASVRNRYENSDDPVAQIAAAYGISVRTLIRWAKQDGWIRRSERPLRDLPEPTRLLDLATALEAQAKAAAGQRAPIENTTGAPHPPLEGEGRSSDPGLDPGEDERGEVNDPATDSARAASEDHPTPAHVLRTFADPPPPGEGEAAATPCPTPGSSPGQALTAAIESAERQVHAFLAAGEARARRARAPTRAEAAEAARTLATLTQTLQKLAALRRGETNPGESDHDDFPRDIDEFRLDLARRIDAFVASRTDPGHVDGDSEPAPMDDVR
jgi:hypothetical protein